MIARKPGRSFARGGRVLPAVRMPCLALALVLGGGAANAQGLRGSFDTLPGADDDFSPYALGPTPSGIFSPETGIEPADPYGLDPGPVEPELPPGTAPPELPEPPIVQRRRPPPVEEDPYAQLGIRAGAFLVKPSIELYGGYDSNPGSDDPPEGSLVGRTVSRLDVESDWARHAFRGRLEHGYRAYDQFPERDAPRYSADAALRLDARHDLRLDFALRGAVDSETRGDPELIGVTTISENKRLGASAGFTWKPNRLSIGMAGELDRRVFEDEDLKDRNYKDYDVRLRSGYELHPGLEPFVEVAGNQRIYDREVNDSGVLHDAWGYRTYVGARVEPNPIWAFEGRIGYGHQEAEDPSLPPLDGIVGEAALIWRPSVLTELRLTAERDFESSTIECCAIAKRWRAGIGLEHEFRRWLILTGDIGFEQSQYTSIDYTVRQLDAELALEYKFNRTLSALGRVSYEKLDSSDSDENYDATIVEIGLRVQR